MRARLLRLARYVLAGGLVGQGLAAMSSGRHALAIACAVMLAVLVRRTIAIGVRLAIADVRAVATRRRARIAAQGWR